jgi:Protein of unknown function DUF86
MPAKEQAASYCFPDVPWAQPARLRNRVLHGYWSIDLEILHTTATDLLPGFVEQLRDVLVVLETDTDEGTPANVSQPGSTPPHPGPRRGRGRKAPNGSIQDSL